MLFKFRQVSLRDFVFHNVSLWELLLLGQVVHVIRNWKVCILIKNWTFHKYMSYSILMLSHRSRDDQGYISIPQQISYKEYCMQMPFDVGWIIKRIWEVIGIVLADNLYDTRNRLYIHHKARNILLYLILLITGPFMGTLELELLMNIVLEFC